MAGLKRKLNGYVLMESIMAMVIVMLCFGTGLMIINNIVSGSRDKMKVLARIRLAQIAVMTKTEKTYLDASIQNDQFRIERHIHSWRESDTVFELELKAIAPDGKILGEYHELFRKE